GVGSKRATRQHPRRELQRNQITGSIPDSIQKLSQLVHLSLSFNQLYGRIPGTITKLTSLIQFDLSHNFLTGPIMKPASLTNLDLSSNYLSGPLLPALCTASYAANCFTLPVGCTAGPQREEAACNAFCGISTLADSASAACSGNGECYPDGSSLVPTCLCDAGFETFQRISCVAEGKSQNYSTSQQILPPSTTLTVGTKPETVGRFTGAPVTLFANGTEKCGVELAFNATFSFTLSPHVSGGNGFAFVISATARVGGRAGVGYQGMDSRSVAVEFDTLDNKVFLSDTAEKPVQPLLERRVLLCAVLRAYGLELSADTYVPMKSSLFTRYASADYVMSASKNDSWRFRDFHSWDSVPFLGWPVKNQEDCNACWAFAVVASIEAAYGIATNKEAPQLAVESLFTAMNLSSYEHQCKNGGSPTEAFEKLVGLPDGGLKMRSTVTGQIAGSLFPVQGFERTQFKGYLGLMHAVQRQPVVVHIEASATSFVQYDGTFKYQDPGCYTGSLNHAVLVIGYYIIRDDGSQNRIAPPFWIIRNSWGVGWGDRGHMRMDIQGGDGVCGINVLPGIYPIVKISGDPCGSKSFQQDLDPQPTMNPCGRFKCRPDSKSKGNTCDCKLPKAARQPFVEVRNGYLSNTCAYVDVCGSYLRNPCTVGTCINDGKGAYSCVCPPNYITTTTIDNFPTCDPVNESVSSIVVSGDNWQCTDVYPAMGLTATKFTQQNMAINCNKPLQKNTVLQVIGGPAIPCTAFFYTLKGDTCPSIASQVGLNQSRLTGLNPGLDCSKVVRPGQSVCVERNATYAYTVPQCVKYGMLTKQDTCERLLERMTDRDDSSRANSASLWAQLYRNNPGLVCSDPIPDSVASAGSNAGVEVRGDREGGRVDEMQMVRRGGL
ncbi:unnamed protein product, partial [Closterium sp. Naga37s-1]